MEPASAASTVAYPQFSVGSVLSRTLRVLFKNPFVFLGLTLMGTLVPAIVETLFPQSQGINLAMRLLGMVLSLVFTGAIAYGVYCSLRGEAVSVGASIARGMARFLPLFGAAALSGLGILAGSLLLVVPGLVLMCVWAVVVPACVVERLGVVDSLGRSAALTKGYRWPVFGLMLLSVVFSAVVVGLLGAGTALIGNLGAALRGNLLVIGVVVAVATAIPAAFQSVLTAIIYYTLREVKEGVSLDKLTNVFD